VKGTVPVAFSFTITDAGRIAAIDLIGDPAVLPGLEVEMADRSAVYPIEEG
jgi:hypothetical protein